MNTPFRSAHRTRPAARTAGFTLVEMLVAVALVVLMLMLFAQIFGDTVRIMREQNALANNDQKARGIETLIRSDLARMTTRQPRVKGVTGLVPLRANWPVDPERQRGYFYISENDVESALDDVIQFTIDGRETHRNPEVVNFKGRAAALDVNDFSPGVAAADANQPDWDDGNFGDNLGESPAAEVVYFLRGGNLYRRQLLLREPHQPTAAGAPAQFDPQPGPGPTGAVVSGMDLYTRKFVRLVGGNWVEGDYSATLDPVSSVSPGHVPVTGGLGDFWNDFDYSAWNWWRDGFGDANPNETMDAIAGGSDRFWLMFNGVDSLKNVPGATPFPLAMPQHRFGHRPQLPGSPPLSEAAKFFEGQPVEYLLNAAGGLAINTAAGSTDTKIDAFIGRYTHEETSSPFFGYPGAVPQDGVPIPRHPMFHNAPGGTPYAAGWDGLNPNSIIDAYEGGPRAGEDLVLANVDSFDIEVWDDGYTELDTNGNGVFDIALEDRNGNGIRDVYPGRWVNIGHAGYIPGTTTSAQLGYFRHSANLNPFYGPRPILVAPFPTFDQGADGAAGVAGANDNGAGGNDELAETGWPYSDDAWNRVFDTWHPNATAGIVPVPVMNPLNPTPGPPYQTLRVPLAAGVQWQRWEDSDFDGMLGSGEDLNGNGALDGTPITFNMVIFPGHEDRNYDNVLQPGEDGEDWNQNGMLDMGEDLNSNSTLDGPNGMLDPGEDRNNNGILDGPEDRNGNGVIDSDLSYYYMPVALLEDLNDNRTLQPMLDVDLNSNGVLNGYTANLATAREPEWPRIPGHTVLDRVDGIDLDGNMTIEERERRGVVWQCFDNRIGLQMVRITIRYRDPSSGAPRQVSIVHSFVE